MLDPDPAAQQKETELRLIQQVQSLRQRLKELEAAEGPSSDAPAASGGPDRGQIVSLLAEQVDLLDRLADHLAGDIAMFPARADRAQAEEALRQYAERLETLHQIDRAIVESQSPEAIARATLARIGRLIPCRYACIATFGTEADQPRILAAFTGDGPQAHGMPEPFDPSRASPLADARSRISVPLISQGELIGTLDLETPSVGGFTREQLEIVYEITAPLAVAIQNARLHERLQQYAGGLAETVARRTQELKAERDRTQAVLESLGEAVIVTDVEGKVLYANPATFALTGLSAEEVLGQEWRTLGSSQAQVYDEALNALRRQQTWRGEMTGQRRDGTPYDVAATVTPLFSPEDPDRLVGAVWVQRDITPLKEAERFKDQFVSDVSHELRTPLSIITLVAGNLERLYDRIDDGKRREMLRSVREQVELLNDLVGDVLEMSRIDSGRISMEREEVDLAQLVRQEVEKQGPLARRKAQAVRVVGLESLKVRGNEGQLRQVVRNVLNNAIKFTPNGGSVTCECLAQEARGATDLIWPGGVELSPGRWAVVRVADTGTGIDPEDLPHLFQRFFRVKTQGEIPGTGLGLAITRELVELHGGHVAVASTPGEGSVFAIYLPLGQEEA